MKDHHPVVLRYSEATGWDAIEAEAEGDGLVAGTGHFSDFLVGVRKLGDRLADKLIPTVDWIVYQSGLVLKRTQPPECETKTSTFPKWVTVTDIEQDENSRVRWCTEVRGDSLVVRVRGNRPYAQVLALRDLVGSVPAASLRSSTDPITEGAAAALGAASGGRFFWVRSDQQLDLVFDQPATGPAVQTIKIDPIPDLAGTIAVKVAQEAAKQNPDVYSQIFARWDCITKIARLLVPKPEGEAVAEAFALVDECLGDLMPPNAKALLAAKRLVTQVPDYATDIANGNPQLDWVVARRALDWRNTHYTTDCAAVKQGDPLQVDVRDGSGVALANEPQRYQVTVVAVATGSLTGPGSQEAAVLLRCHPDPSNFSRTEVQVFRSSGDKIATLQPPDLHPEGTGLSPDFAEARFTVTNGRLLTGADYYAAGDCHAGGPTLHHDIDWAWNGAGFEPRAAPVTPGPGHTCGPALSEASQLVLDGIGPIRVGMSIAEAEASARTTLPAGVGPNSTDDCSTIRPSSGPAGLSFIVSHGQIRRVDVRSPSRIATKSGIRIGDTESDVMARYPGQIRVSPHGLNPRGGGHYLRLIASDASSSPFEIIFETDGQRVTSFRSGFVREVEFVEGCA
jgi:hypothetical protein